MCPEKHKTARVSTDSMANCVTFALSEVTRRLGPRKDSPYSEKPGTFLPERLDLSPSLQPPFYRSPHHDTRVYNYFIFSIFHFFNFKLWLVQTFPW